MILPNFLIDVLGLPSYVFYEVGNFVNDQNNEFYIGPARIVRDRNLIIGDDQRQSVEPRIMDVLALLASRPKDVISRDEFISSVWNVEFGGDESLTRAISILRKALKKAGVKDQVIETIPKRGYRLAVEITENNPKPGNPMTIGAENLAIKSEPSATTLSTPHSNIVQPVAVSKPALPRSRGSIPPMIGALVLLALAFIWYLLGDRRGPDEVLETPANIEANINVNETTSPPLINKDIRPSQAELAMGIMFTYLDGNMSKEDALESAERHTRLARKEDADSAATLTAEGWVKYLQDDQDRALLLFETAITNYPLQSDAWLGKAYVFYDQKKIDLAILNADQAITLDSFSIYARMAKARFNFDAGKLEQAKADAYAVLSFDPSNKVAQDILTAIENR